jgi:very-short-patch-repair endonuclease
MVNVICIGVTFSASRFPDWSPAVWHMRWYNQPMRIPTARIRELRASPTEAEKVAWNLLRDRRLGAKFRRQFRIENGVLDFYCFEHRLAIELDGGVHSQIDQMRKDAAKEDYLRTLGIRLLRIPNAMVLEHPDEFVREVVEAIRASVEKAK